MLTTTIVSLVAGIDEAGRGPLAGPVVAAAVILDPRRRIRGLRDSKLLTERQRDDLAAEIRVKAVAWSVGEACVEEIDRMNILQATMPRCGERSKGSRSPGVAWIDGDRCRTSGAPCCRSSRAIATTRSFRQRRSSRRPRVMQCWCSSTASIPDTALA
jgi:ribonuclease HII